MVLDKQLLAILACPRCKKSLEYDRKKNKLICKNCRLRYKIIDGDIPDMLIEDAERL